MSTATVDDTPDAQGPSAGATPANPSTRPANSDAQSSNPDSPTANPDAQPSAIHLLRWMASITKPVHAPLIGSTLCRILQLCLDAVLFGMGAFGAVSLVMGQLASGFLWALVGVAVAKATLYYLEQFMGHFVAFRALELLRTSVYANLWPKAPAIVTQSRSGDLLASLTRDIDRIEVVYAHTVAPVISAYVVTPVILTWAGVTAGFAPVSVAIVCYLLSIAVVPFAGEKHVVDQSSKTLAARRNLTHHVVDSVYGMDEVLNFNRPLNRLDETERWGSVIAQHSTAMVPGIRRGANVALMLIAAISFVWMAPPIGAPMVAAVTVVLLRVAQATRGLEDAMSACGDALASIGRLFAIVHTPAVVEDGPVALGASQAPTVTVSHVSYSYPSLSEEPTREALHDVTFTVPGGGHCVIVGRSGSGKSTLLHLLSRYMDPASGKILVADTDIRSVTLDSLRRSVVPVSQDTQLLADTIEVNLRLGAPDATSEELWEALDVAGLAEEVRAMPDGLGTWVAGKKHGTSAYALSGGQVQRLCLARALLMKPSVLILDEFAARLDAPGEARIRARLRETFPHVTIIEVTHQLRDVSGVDVGVVVDQGRVRIVEPSKLLDFVA